MAQSSQTAEELQSQEERIRDLARADTAASFASNIPRADLPSGFWKTTLQGTCPRCKHLHRKATIKIRISNFPGIYNGIRCEKCNHPWFGLGGNETRTSLISEESRALSLLSTASTPSMAQVVSVCRDEGTRGAIGALIRNSMHSMAATGAPVLVSVADDQENQTSPATQPHPRSSNLLSRNPSRESRHHFRRLSAGRQPVDAHAPEGPTLPTAGVELDSQAARKLPLTKKAKGAVKAGVDRIAKRFGYTRLHVESQLPSALQQPECLTPHQQTYDTPRSANGVTQPGGPSVSVAAEPQQGPSPEENRSDMAEEGSPTRLATTLPPNSPERTANDIIKSRICNGEQRIALIRRQKTEEARQRALRRQEICQCTESCQCRQPSTPSYISIDQVPDHPVIQRTLEPNSGSQPESDTRMMVGDSTLNQPDHSGLHPPAQPRQRAISEPSPLDFAHFGGQFNYRDSVGTFRSQASTLSPYLQVRDSQTSLSVTRSPRLSIQTEGQPHRFADPLGPDDFETMEEHEHIGSRDFVDGEAGFAGTEGGTLVDEEMESDRTPTEASQLG